MNTKDLMERIDDIMNRKREEGCEELSEECLLLLDAQAALYNYSKFVDKWKREMRDVLDGDIN